MVTQDFRDLIRIATFRPFRLVMSSGHVYDVRHPEMGSVSRTTIFVYTPPSRRPAQGHAGLLLAAARRQHRVP